MEILKKTALLLIITILFVDRAQAWPTRLYSDKEVVNRAELIVIARIKKGSIKKIFRQNGASYEHSAILILARIIKGELREEELPIIIHYGLLPVSARYEKKMYPDEDAIVRSVPEEPGETVRIYEDNPSEGFFRPSGDMHKNQIWLLRHHRSLLAKDYPDVATTDLLGIWDPEDLQKLERENDLVKHLRLK